MCQSKENEGSGNKHTEEYLKYLICVGHRGQAEEGSKILFKSTTSARVSFSLLTSKTEETIPSCG